MTATPNEIAKAAHAKVGANPQAEADMRAEWRRVEDAISAHVAASEKRWKNYEIHHLARFARLEMLKAIVAGKSTREAAAAALERVGLNPTTLISSGGAE